MKALVFGRISVAKAGWLIALFLIAWPLFVLVPFGRKPAPPAPHLSPRSETSRLPAVGLVPNSDWEGLPELFAVWQEHAEWNEGKTQFAYWHPGSRSYVYFFEARREAGTVRFRALTDGEAITGGLMAQTIDLTENSPTHPFVFLHEAKSKALLTSRPAVAPPNGILTHDPTEPKTVKVQILDEPKDK
jgi:hypothetical protein